MGGQNWTTKRRAGQLWREGAGWGDSLVLPPSRSWRDPKGRPGVGWWLEGVRLNSEKVRGNGVLRSYPSWSPVPLYNIPGRPTPGFGRSHATEAQHVHLLRSSLVRKFILWSSASSILESCHSPAFEAKFLAMGNGALHNVASACLSNPNLQLEHEIFKTNTYFPDNLKYPFCCLQSRI